LVLPWACVIGLLTGWPAPAQDPPTEKTAVQAADPLATLNAGFRAAYRRARSEALAGARPVVLVEGDNLVLLWQGGREEAQAIPAAYHHLKAVAHIPLAIYVLLAAHTNGNPEEGCLAELRRFRELILAVRTDLEKRGFTPSQLERQQKIVSVSLDFLDDVLKQSRVTSEDLVCFARRMAPPVLANADDATQVELDGLHARMTAWRRQLSAAEWKNLRVVIMGAQLPRKGNLAVQYFARLLGEPGEGARIIYAEALYEEPRALDLLGTHLIDTDIGAAFFDDKLRMHRDLLSDAAAAYLKKMTFGP
jgi:hypothetical protein